MQSSTSPSISSDSLNTRQPLQQLSPNHTPQNYTPTTRDHSRQQSNTVTTNLRETSSSSLQANLVTLAKPTTPPTVSTARNLPISPSSSQLQSATSPASTVSIGSTLSATAPQFQTRLADAPIDIHTLNFSPGSDHLSPQVPDSPIRSRSLTGTTAASPADMLDITMSSALNNEGKTPTQDSFGLKQSLAYGTQVTSSSSTILSEEASGSVGEGSTTFDDPSMHTPNVYINGLPPNFPEESLYAMTSPFGEVISVRTFTRHVSDKPSGYGFVLFGSVEAAERCIESLRKYRNLHPSFSKRLHKIPGTAYATVDPNATSPHMPATDSELTQSDSFKARMERLKDNSSTNLYIEGLPLSINEQTLAALVHPYRIMSNRFFQTRLSTPPRIIAFVRLESRKAAEDVIERLHGRMVRGWNDPGARISVRFADTAEQRELRRAERVPHDEEQSPSRLTIAHASLLNMKGTQLQGQPSITPSIPSPNFGLSPAFNSNLALPSDSLYDQLGYVQPSPPMAFQHLDRGYVQARQGQNFRTAVSPPLHTTGLPSFEGLNVHASEFNALSPSLRIPQHMIDLHNSQPLDLDAQLALLNIGVGASGPARAQDGFTQQEKLLLEAYVQRQQEASRTANLAAARGSLHARGQSGLGGSRATTGSNGRRLGEYLPSMSEEDFHSGSTQLSQRQLLSDSHLSSYDAISSIVLPRTSQTSSQAPVRMSLDDINARLSFTRQRNQTHSSAEAARAQVDNQSLHARSTTLPSHYSSKAVSQGFSSIRSNDNISKAITISNVSNIPNVSNFGNKNKSAFGTSNNHFNRIGNSNSTMHKHSRDNNIQNSSNIPVEKTPNSLKTSHARIDTNSSALLAHPQAGPNAFGTPRNDQDETGSPLDSPALTHSTHTPASLSPSTPFSAFSESFENAPSVTLSASQAEVGLGMGIVSSVAETVKEGRSTKTTEATAVTTTEAA
ncbi:hypothetical protein ABKN59_011666 [Abortiporus biennis]